MPRLTPTRYVLTIYIYTFNIYVYTGICRNKNDKKFLARNILGGHNNGGIESISRLQRRNLLGGMTIYQSALDVIIYNDNFYNISDNRLSNGYN